MMTGCETGCLEARTERLFMPLRPTVLLYLKNRSNQFFFEKRKKGRSGRTDCRPDQMKHMRTEPFTMERNVLNVGDVVAVTEGKLPRAYYYTAEPAAAMSKNFASNERIRSDHGTVVKKDLEGSTYTVWIEFEE